jgi:hypothetical protein
LLNTSLNEQTHMYDVKYCTTYRQKFGFLKHANCLDASVAIDALHCPRHILSD